MSEYQTHTALAAALEEEISRLTAINSALKGSIQTPIQPDTNLVQAARKALEAMHFYMTAWNGGEVTWFRECYKAEDKVCAAITALREALEAVPQPAAVEQEPVLVVEREPSYMDRGHFYKGDKPHIDPTKVWKLPIGTKLYTAPQPAAVALEPVAFKQFLSGVLTAAGLLEHGKQSKALAARIADAAVLYMTTTPQPARQPLPPASPCAMTEAEYRLFKLGWLEAEAAHGIGGEA